MSKPLPYRTIACMVAYWMLDKSEYALTLESNIRTAVRRATPPGGMWRGRGRYNEEVWKVVLRMRRQHRLVVAAVRNEVERRYPREEELD